MGKPAITSFSLPLSPSAWICPVGFVEGSNRVIAREELAFLKS
ncbi:MAG TPA: hypothetical protein VMS94_04625 [Acidobacteriota bacterium]|nr:hypothetical protein [Acidobacteriota bacterium]